MSFWSRLRNTFSLFNGGRFEETRNFQNQLDYFNVALALSYYEEHAQHAPKMNHSFNDEALSRENNLSSKSPTFHRRYVEEGIAKQLLRMFEYMDKEGAINPYPPLEKRMDVFIRKNSFEGGEIALNSPTIKDLLKKFEYEDGKEVRHPDGFSLQIRKSSIDHLESGYGKNLSLFTLGVFVKGHVLPGTVLGLYPGYTQFPPDLTKEILQNNPYLIARYDGVIIDGREWGVEAGEKLKDRMAFEYALGNEGPTPLPDSLKKYCNSFANGSYLNHPPPNCSPNVLCVGHNISKEKSSVTYLPPHLQPYIPYIHRRRRIFFEQGNVYYAQVAVALRHLKDEELFLNYRFNPAHPYPDWYSQPNEEEAKRRWGKVTLLS